MNVLSVKISRAKGIQHASFWAAAVVVGIAAVIYARVIAWTQGVFFWLFGHAPYLTSALGPLAFLLATTLVRRLAPEAKGSGIPQVLEAIELGGHNPGAEQPWRSPLISLRTAAVKVVSSIVGILGGASIGREGPTVQVAASVFAGVGARIRKYAPDVELPSYLVAGAAAGVAAAFNTPVAGITFAIEEIIDGAWGSFRQTMMVAVILAGITSQAFSGNYLYFGRPAISSPTLDVIYEALVIGVVGGALGGVFSRLLAYPSVVRLPRQWARRAFLCGVVCAILCIWTHGATAGSGYEAAEAILREDSARNVSVMFPVYKLLTTVLSYLSGMAGGIFSPSLSIGAGIGMSLAKLLHFVNFRTCTLMGMVAFFSGVVQAPLTAVIIVMEMTDRHILILPFMVAAFTGHGLGKLVMPTPLYHFLAKRNEEG